MARLSRDKGKRGERELAEFFRAHGVPARRGQQYRGGGESQDLAHELYGFHVECKRTEAFRLYAALEQAKGERKPGDIPAVFHRTNQRPWVVVLDASDFLTLAKSVAPSNLQANVPSPSPERAKDPENIACPTFGAGMQPLEQEET